MFSFSGLFESIAVCSGSKLLGLPPSLSLYSITISLSTAVETMLIRSSNYIFSCICGLFGLMLNLCVFSFSYHSLYILGHITYKSIVTAFFLASLLFAPYPFETTCSFIFTVVKNLSLGLVWCSCCLLKFKGKLEEN